MKTEEEDVRIVLMEIAANERFGLCQVIPRIWLFGVGSHVVFSSVLAIGGGSFVVCFLKQWSVRTSPRSRLLTPLPRLLLLLLNARLNPLRPKQA
jgi:hypothetical protein